MRKHLANQTYAQLCNYLFKTNIYMVIHGYMAIYGLVSKKIDSVTASFWLKLGWVRRIHRSHRISLIIEHKVRSMATKRLITVLKTMTWPTWGRNLPPLSPFFVHLDHLFKPLCFLAISPTSQAPTWCILSASCEGNKAGGLASSDFVDFVDPRKKVNTLINWFRILISTFCNLLLDWEA